MASEKGPLQQSFGGDSLKLRSEFKVPRQVRQYFVEMDDSRSKIGQHRRTVSSGYKEGSSVSQNAIHVTNQLMRRTNQKRGPEL